MKLVRHMPGVNSPCLIYRLGLHVGLKVRFGIELKLLGTGTLC